jgi:hypothetical protein
MNVVTSVNNDDSDNIVIQENATYYQTEATPLVDKIRKQTSSTTTTRRRKKRKSYCINCDMSEYIKSILFGGLDGISTGIVFLSYVCGIIIN